MSFFPSKDLDPASLIGSLNLAFEDEYKEILKNQSCKPASPPAKTVEAQNSDCSTKPASKSDSLNCTPIQNDLPSNVDGRELGEKQSQVTVKEPSSSTEKKTADQSNSSALPEAHRQKIVLRLKSTALNTYTALPSSPPEQEQSAISPKTTEPKKPATEPSKGGSAPKKTVIIPADGDLLKAKKRSASDESGAKQSKQSKLLVRKQLNYINSVGTNLRK